jgi:hypothetical protein
MVQTSIEYSHRVPNYYYCSTTSRVVHGCHLKCSNCLQSVELFPYAANHHTVSTQACAAAVVAGVSLVVANTLQFGRWCIIIVTVITATLGIHRSSCCCSGGTSNSNLLCRQRTRNSKTCVCTHKSVLVALCIHMCSIHVKHLTLVNNSTKRHQRSSSLQLTVNQQALLQKQPRQY